MKPILIIAPHIKVARAAERVAQKYSDVAVRLGLLEQSLSMVRQAQATGVDVLISRGGTAQMLEEQFHSVPVVMLPVSPYDLLIAIHRAKAYGRNIVVIGFDLIIQGVEQLAPILDVNITAQRVENQLDANVHLRRLLENGQQIDVLLGGAVAEKLAHQYGIPTVFLETDTATIENSIKEARKLLDIRNRERQKTEQARAILHYVNQGVMAIDANGYVTTFNPAACKITGIRKQDILGKRIDRVLPGSRIMEVMEDNLPELGQLERIGQGMTLANLVPIVVNGKPMGAVKTFEDVTRVQAYEQKIRSKLLKKGHFARYSITDIIGNSPAIRESKNLARKYAQVDSTVLIVGNSGTGKEMFAQSIHNLSRNRSNSPFVAVNCSAIPENLLESELFGYEQGAFTGARKKGKAGLFTVAHKGTIFLDEITEMPIALQARLLRVIQEKEVLPLGSETVIPVDIRIIAATNTDLIEAVRQGKFRSDLYFRLNILNLRIPNLTEREQDIRLLAELFTRTHSQRLDKNLKLTAGAMRILESYAWPGNIRELENIVERLCVISDTRIREPDVQSIIDNLAPLDENNETTIRGMTRAHVTRTLAECGGNRGLAAKHLGISRTSLWRILKEIQHDARAI